MEVYRGWRGLIGGLQEVEGADRRFIGGEGADRWFTGDGRG